MFISLHFLLFLIFFLFFISIFTVTIIFKKLKKNNNNKLKKISVEKFLFQKSEYINSRFKTLRLEICRLRKYFFLNNEKFRNLSIQNSIFKKKIISYSKIKLNLKSQIAKKEKLIKYNLMLEKKVSELNALLLSEKKYISERNNSFIGLKKNILDEFRIIIGNVFKDEVFRFSKYNKNQILDTVFPLKEKINDFKRKIEDIYYKESRDRSALLNELTNLKNLNENIGKDAINLTKALKGNIKIQGGWGEIVLERVLEMSGLQKGKSYNLQVHLKHSNGNFYRPDAIIHLPESKDVVVDSKVSLKNYETCCSTNNSLYRKRALKKHINSIKSHIKTLSSKSYEKLLGIKSLDFVLMFIPIEEAYFMAIREEISILSDAFKRNVFIVCPSTLLITLRTINHIWLNDNQKKNSLEIARQAGEMYDKFVVFLSSIEDIGKQLDKAKDSYLLSKNRLMDGKGNLIKRAKKLKNLGLKTRKTIPDSFKD